MALAALNFKLFIINLLLSNMTNRHGICYANFKPAPSFPPSRTSTPGIGGSKNPGYVMQLAVASEGRVNVLSCTYNTLPCRKDGGASCTQAHTHTNTLVVYIALDIRRRGVWVEGPVRIQMYDDYAS